MMKILKDSEFTEFSNLLTESIIKVQTLFQQMSPSLEQLKKGWADLMFRYSYLLNRYSEKNKNSDVNVQSECATSKILKFEYTVSNILNFGREFYASEFATLIREINDFEVEVFKSVINTFYSFHDFLGNTEGNKDSEEFFQKLLQKKMDDLNSKYFIIHYLIGSVLKKYSRFGKIIYVSVADLPAALFLDHVLNEYTYIDQHRGEVMEDRLEACQEFKEVYEPILQYHSEIKFYMDLIYKCVFGYIAKVIKKAWDGDLDKFGIKAISREELNEKIDKRYQEKRHENHA